MQYDPTERRPTIEEILDAINTQDNDTTLARLVFPQYAEQGLRYEATLYFQNYKRSVHSLNENRSKSDKQWMLAVLVDILRGVSEATLKTFTYSDIPPATWQLPPHMNDITIETANTHLRLNKNSVIDYGWRLDLAPHDHFDTVTVDILRLDTQYVIFLTDSSID